MPTFDTDDDEEQPHLIRSTTPALLPTPNKRHFPFPFDGQIRAQAVSLPEVLHELNISCPPAAEHDKSPFLETLCACANLLSERPGGIIVVVMQAGVEIEFDHLDGGHLTTWWHKHAPNIHKNSDNFKRILTTFCRHSDSDRWEPDLLQELRTCVDGDHYMRDPLLRKLQNQPKDGAIMLSENGTLLFAAGRLPFPSECQLIKHDGSSCGTRHNAALGCTEFLGTLGDIDGVPGVVFVRSDTGGLHTCLPTGEEKPPTVLWTETESPESTDDEDFGEDVIRLMSTSSLRSTLRRTLTQPGIQRDSSLSAKSKMSKRLSLERGLPLFMGTRFSNEQFHESISKSLTTNMSSEDIPLTSDFQREASFNKALDVMIRAFQVEVPSFREGVLEDLKIPTEFGMRILAVESKAGVLELSIHAKTELRCGNMIWLALQGDDKCKLKEFLGLGVSEELSSRVKHSMFPLFSILIPQPWLSMKLSDLQLKGKYGFSILGVETESHVVQILPAADDHLPNLRRRIYCHIVNMLQFEEARKDLESIVHSQISKTATVRRITLSQPMSRLGSPILPKQALEEPKYLFIPAVSELAPGVLQHLAHFTHAKMPGNSDAIILRVEAPTDLEARGRFDTLRGCATSVTTEAFAKDVFDTLLSQDGGKWQVPSVPAPGCCSCLPMFKIGKPSQVRVWPLGKNHSPHI